MSLDVEKLRWREGFKMVAGVDEVGRGALAGDVFAVALVLPRDIEKYEWVSEITDSKLLSPKKRERLSGLLREVSQFSIGRASVGEIDQINILNATKLAMKRAISGVDADYVLVDGNFIPDIEQKCECLIDGDVLSLSIASASIVAKVERDKYMEEMAKCYPLYRFEKHKGYGTKLHYEALVAHGACALHRKQFIRNVAKKGGYCCAE